MSQPFLGSIHLFGGNFAPRGYMLCQGQLLSIAQNSALFALIGTVYGGDGVTTFALPNLAGRAPVHQFQGPGLSNYVLGQSLGVESVTLSSNQMPTHSHIASASTSVSGGGGPAGAFWAQPSSGQPYGAAPNVAMNPAALSAAGGNQPHENMMPFLAINFIIAVEGIFPSRN